MFKLSLAVLGAVFIGMTSQEVAASEIKVGSKQFTENVILGEAVKLVLTAGGHNAVHVRELGGTRILWNALRSGELDAYPEYTGTLAYEILQDRQALTTDALRPKLEAIGIGITEPIGFNNTYAMTMTRKLAKKLDIKTISDLKRHPDLRLGFSNEFIDRADGWIGLKAAYGLPQTNVRGLDHDLAYRGLQAGSIDIVDGYSTDAEIAYYDLVALEDDRHFFPDYQAIIVYRLGLAADAIRSLEGLSGKISAGEIQRLNSASKFEKRNANDVASEFLQDSLGVDAVRSNQRWFDRLLGYSIDHFALVAISLTAAIFTAIPLGILSAKIAPLRQLVLGLTGILQTIPSLALLVFMIPLLGIGTVPAIAALYLYSLLPIVRNTCQGLLEIPRSLRDAGVVMGLPRKYRLFRIELPLASGSIVAGIKTSAVINIGTATLGALVGAGGYGQPILTGIRLDDTGLILLGAIPAAVMALLAQFIFEVLERKIAPVKVQ